MRTILIACLGVVVGALVGVCLDLASEPSAPPALQSGVTHEPGQGHEARAERPERFADSEIEPVLADLDSPELRRQEGLVSDVDALVRLGETDPTRALLAAASLPTEAARGVALARLGSILAQRDPLKAIVSADVLRSRALRERYESAVLGTWLQTAPEELLVLFGADPLRDVELFTIRTGSSLFRSELWRRVMQARVSEANPEARKLLARILGGGDRGLVSAESDDARADAPVVSSPSEIVARIGELDERALAETAYRLVGAGDSSSRSALSAVVSRWAVTDTTGALTWVLANAEHLSSSVVTALAQRVAQQDPALAASIVYRLPEVHRASWLRAAAKGVVDSGADAALQFLEPFRNEASYDSAVRDVVVAVADVDPAWSARALANSAISGPTRHEAAAYVTQVWVARDPGAAAEFAASYADSAARSHLVLVTAETWADNDREAAQRWLASLPVGETRDAAISGFVAAVAKTGTFAEEMLAAYSNGRARDNGVASAIAQVGLTDIERARRLAAAHIRDPELRRATEERLAREGGTGRQTTVIRPSALSIFKPQ